jgi:biopolymer transport protein ExbD
MGTVAVEQSGGSARRSVDSEVNLIPMIDLFVCCISFLLITAVWSQTSRLEARADEPGNGVSPPEPAKVLHVDMRGDQSFKLTWQVGTTVMSSSYVPKQVLQVGPQNNMSRYPDLAKRIEEEWATQGDHRNAKDRGLDHAVVHTGTTTSFEEIVATIDAIYSPKRRVEGSAEPVAAFRVGFATD